MKRRGWRWIFLVLALACLLRILFGKEDSVWAVVGFFASLGAWYGLTWLKTRELDAPRPR